MPLKRTHMLFLTCTFSLKRRALLETVEYSRRRLVIKCNLDLSLAAKNQVAVPAAAAAAWLAKAVNFNFSLEKS